MQVDLINERWRSLFSLAIRALSLSSKFLLILLLTETLSADELGVYGLISAIIVYAVFFVGFDFYTYTQKSTISASKDNKNQYISYQLIFNLLLYFVSAGLIVLAGSGFGIPEKFLPFLLIIIFFEFLCLEYIRYLTALMMPNAANFVQFLKNGFWCLLFIAIYCVGLINVTVTSVLALWCFGLVFCSILSFWFVKDVGIFSLRYGLDVAWLVGGVREVLIMFMSTIVLRGIYIIDKILISQLVSMSFLGAYTFYFAVSSVISSFLEAVVFLKYSPKILMHARDRALVKYSAAMRDFSRKTILYSLGISALVIPSLVLYSRLTTNEFVSEYVGYGVLLVISQVLFSISLIPHTKLYVFDRNGLILAGNIAALVAFLVCFVMTFGQYPILSVPFSVFLSSVSLLCVKYLLSIGLEKGVMS